MTAQIYINGVIGEDTTLTDVIRQYKSFEGVTDVNVFIKSVGGYVEEGEAIYSYLKNIGVPVTTFTSEAYSIAAHIFSAGDRRVIDDVDGAFMIHFAWADGVSGTANELETIAKELRGIEGRFEQFYSELIGVDKGTISRLLDSQTFLSGSEAVEMGFATELRVATKAVAKLNINQKSNKMNKKESALIKALRSFMGIGQDALALVLQDATGVEINFPDLDAGDIPSVGDRAEIDGAPAEGSYVMPQLENSTVVFVDGVVTEILPESEEDVVDDEAEIQEMLSQLEARLEKKMMAKIEEKNKEIKVELSKVKAIIGSKEPKNDGVQAKQINPSSENFMQRIARAKKQ